MIHAYTIAAPNLPEERTVFGLNGCFEENLSLIAAAGFEGVELVIADPYGLDAMKLQEQICNAGLKAVMIATGEMSGMDGISLSDRSDASRREAIRRFNGMADIAAILGCGINIGRSRGIVCEKEEKSEVMKRMIDSFWIISDYAFPLGVSYALEPVATCYMNTLNDMSEVVDCIRQVGRNNFTYMLDTQHMFLGEKDMMRTIRRYGKDALHVHLTDSERHYPGTGKLDFASIIQAFYEAGYNGAFSHESSPFPDQITCLKRSAEYMTPILAKYYK